MFGENLHKILQAQKISGKELSQLTNISQSTISKFLSGNQEPRYSQILSISKALQVQPDIFMLTSNPHPSINPPMINEYCMVRELYNDLGAHLHITSIYAFKEFTIEIPVIDNDALFVVAMIEGRSHSKLGPLCAGEFRVVKGIDHRGVKVTVHKGSKAILYIMDKLSDDFLKNWSRMFFENVVQQNEKFPK